MIQKMPTDNRVCKALKELAKAIPSYEKMIATAIKRRDNATDSDPIELQRRKEALTALISWNSSHLQGMKEAYKAILGIEYGSKQSHEIYKPSMDDYLSSTLYRRGITKIQYEDIEPKDGRPYVRIYWTEKIE